MSLHLYEKFILLALDPKKGTFIIDALSLNNGLAGAILLELSEQNKIEIKNRKIRISDNKLTSDSIIDTCIKSINGSRKDRKPRYWIYKLGNKSSGFKKIILKDLYDKRIVRLDIKEFMWGFIKVKRYPLISTKIVDEIKNSLKNTVVNEGKPEISALLLLSLLHSCKLTHILFKSKKEHQMASKRLKELTKDIEIGEAVGQTLKEIQAAILIATTSTFVNTSAH